MYGIHILYAELSAKSKTVKVMQNLNAYSRGIFYVDFDDITESNFKVSVKIYFANEKSIPPYSKREKEINWSEYKTEEILVATKLPVRISVDAMPSDTLLVKVELLEGEVVLPIDISFDALIEGQSYGGLSLEQELHYASILNYYDYFIKAEELFRTAKIVSDSLQEPIKRIKASPTLAMTFEGMSIESGYPSFIQLLGLAVENIIKGAIVKLKGTSISYNDYIKYIFNHDTNKLIEIYLPNLELSRNEEQMLETMVDSVRWRSRYSVSKDVELPKKYFGYNIKTIEKTIQSHIDFCERLKSEFNTETGWQTGGIDPTTGRISSGSMKLARF